METWDGGDHAGALAAARGPGTSEPPLMTGGEFRALRRADRGAALVRLHVEATAALRARPRGGVIPPLEAEELVAALVAEAAGGTPTWLRRAPAMTALRAWLAAALRIRSRARRRETAHGLATLRQEAVGLARECSPEADERREAASASRSSECEKLRRLLAQIPFRQRTAVGLRLKSHTFTEVGKIMRVRRDTAADLVKKAKHSLGELSAGRRIGPERCVVPRLRAETRARLAPDESRLYAMVVAGRTRSQMAESLGCTPKSVERRLARLRNVFCRTALQPREGPPTPTICH